MKKIPTALLWGLALLLALGAAARLLPRPSPPMEEVEITFSLGALPTPLLEGAEGLLGEGSLAGEPVCVLAIESRPILRPAGFGGAPRALPSATQKTGMGRGTLAGVFREGSFFAGGTVYLAPGARVWIENERACFFVQILSISAAE